MRTKIWPFFLLVLLPGCVSACTTAPQPPTVMLAATAPAVTPPRVSFTPTRLASPTPVPVTATAVPTFAASGTPTPSPTSTALPALDARQYLATTEADAIRVAQWLNYLVNDGHPSNVSGPLALAILRDAGIVEAGVDLHDFWLLDPRQAVHRLETTFPRRSFLWFRTETPVSAFDFDAFPLETGDLLYLYAGPGDSFEHFLVVTRVDANGSAFTVTSHNTPGGYLIEELPLAVLFAAWAAPENRSLGLTGGGGFSLWRQRKTVGDTPQARLAHALDETLITYGGDWQVLIRQTRGDVLYSKQADRPVHIASVIKLPIALLFLKSVEAQAGDDLPGYLDLNGVDGRSYRQLLEFMLVRSEEDAAESLQKAIPANGLNGEAMLDAWGLPDTALEPRQSTAQDVARMLAGLYAGEFVNAPARSLLMDLLHTYTPNDDLRLGSLREKLPGVAVYNKRGTLTDPLLIVADAALVVWDAGDPPVSFEVVVFARNPAVPGPATTYELLNQAIEEIAILFGQYLRETVAAHGS
ncbi:MAG: serine hydrolase [Chloroflexota bacterium]